MITLYHDKIGDIMKQLLWDLFCKTGKIEYYIKYKNMEEGSKDGSRSREEI